MSKDKDINLTDLNSADLAQRLLSIIHHSNHTKHDETLDNVKSILECDVDLKSCNSMGNNAFHVTTNYTSDLHMKTYDMIMEYAKKNCNDQIKEMINHRNRNQCTPLHFMVQGNWPKEKVKELLDLGANPSLKFFDHSSKEEVDIIEYLENHPNEEYNDINFESYFPTISLNSVLLPLNPSRSLPKFVERENDRKSNNNQFKNVKG